MRYEQNSKNRSRGKRQARCDVDGTKRGLWIVVVLIVWMFAIIGRLVWLQVVRYDHYVEKAQRNQQRDGKLLATRGAILDRDGKELAVTLLSDRCSALVKEICAGS
jgi:cell division protein FtsI/penicillin-binding protein 2